MAKFDLLTLLTLNAGGFQDGINKAKKSTQEFGEATQAISEGIKTAFTSMLGAIGLAGGAYETFKAIVESTAGSQLQMNIALDEGKNATDYFFKSLASGDFTDFVQGLKDAVAEGKNYAEVMEEIENKANSVKMMNADEILKAAQLELIWRDRTLDPKVREDAMNKWVKIRQDAADRTARIAEDEYQNELENIAKVNKYKKETLETALRDYSANEEELKRLREAGVFSNVKSNTAALGFEGAMNSNVVFDKKTSTYRKLTEEEAKLVREYYNFELLTKKEKDPLVAKYEAAKQAGAASVEVQIHTLRAKNQIEGAENKITKANEKQTDEQKKQNDLLEKQKKILDDIAARKRGDISMFKENMVNGSGTGTGKKFNYQPTPNFIGMMSEDQMDAEHLKAQRVELEKLNQAIEDGTKKVNAYGDMFTGIGEILTGVFSAGKKGFQQMLVSILGGISKMISGYAALAMAGMLGHEVSKKGLVGLATAAAGIAAIAGVIASLPKFEQGGIIGGNSLSGDNNIIRVNSREGVLTMGDQARLWDFIRGGNMGGSINGRLYGQGTQLIAVIDNTISQRNSFR